MFQRISSCFSCSSFHTSNNVQILQKPANFTKTLSQIISFLNFSFEGKKGGWGELFSAHSLKKFGKQELSWVFLFNTSNLGLFLMKQALAKDEFQMLQDDLNCCWRPTKMQLCKGDIETSSPAFAHGGVQYFPVSRAGELHAPGSKTYRTGKFESSCGRFPKQIMKEYSALNSEQPNYAFYRIFIYESADHRLEGQTFLPLRPLVIPSGEPRKNSLKKFSPVLFRKKAKVWKKKKKKK